MLDIGFSELLVVGGVALVVLGPEKLAVLARTAGKWTGKAQRYVADVKADIAREGELAELRKLKEDMETTGREVGASLRSSASEVQHDLTALETTVKKDLNQELGSLDQALEKTSALSEQEASATIQASLDAGIQAPHYTPPPIDMTGRYQSSLNATQSAPLPSPPPLHDPIAQRMELEALQDDLTRLENRMTTLKSDLKHASEAHLG